MLTNVAGSPTITCAAAWPVAPPAVCSCTRSTYSKCSSQVRICARGITRHAHAVHEGRAIAGVHRPQYGGYAHAARQIYASGGVRALYTGLAPNLLGHVVAWGLYFQLYACPIRLRNTAYDTAATIYSNAIFPCSVRQWASSTRATCCAA
jgi:hypothetical protein